MTVDRFVGKADARVAQIKVGAQCSHGRLEKVLNYIGIDKREGGVWLL
jgi:hypothetical protein